MRSLFNQDWRLVAAKIAGGTTFLAIGLVFIWALNELDITTYIEYDEPRRGRQGDYDYDVEGYSSPLGIASGLIAVLIGWIVGSLIYNGPPPLKDRVELQSIGAGLVFYGVVGQIWFELFYGDGWRELLLYHLELATAGLAYWLFKKWHDRRIKDLDSRSPAPRVEAEEIAPMAIPKNIP